MTTLAGADFSTYQAAPDFDQVKQQVAFVFIKATEGWGYADNQFDRSWAEAKRVQLIKGAYHFAHPELGNTPEDEADWFLNVVRPAPGDLLGLDYEVDYADPVGWCTRFCDRVRALTGTSPYIYLNLSTVRGHDWTPAMGYPLWLASYDGSPDFTPNLPWPVAIKQWTSGGALAGVRGNVDLNTFFGTAGQLVAKATTTVPTSATGVDVAFKDDQDAQAFVKDVHDTLEAIKAVLATSAHHTHIYAGKSQPETFGGRTSQPLVPPVPGANYFSSDDSLSVIGWSYPDGVVHFFQNGVELPDK